MGVESDQVAMNDTTTTQIISPSVFNVQGNATTPLPTIIKNIDGTDAIYIGASDVTTSTGLPLAAGESLPIAWLGTDAEYLYGISATGTPIIAVLAAQQ